MNKVILKGRMTADAEMKSTSNGVEYCVFSIAIDRRAKDGEKQTDFVPCKAWRQTAAFVDKYFGKGKEILLEGEIHIDKYEKDGENRSYTYINVLNVEFCGSKSSNEQSESVPTADPLKVVKDKLDTLVDSGTQDGDLPF